MWGAVRAREREGLIPALFRNGVAQGMHSECQRLHWYWRVDSGLGDVLIGDSPGGFLFTCVISCLTLFVLDTFQVFPLLMHRKKIDLCANWQAVALIRSHVLTPKARSARFLPSFLLKRFSCQNELSIRRAKQIPLLCKHVFTLLLLGSNLPACSGAWRECSHWD